MQHVPGEYDTQTPFAHELHRGKSHEILSQAAPYDLENIRTQQLLTFYSLNHIKVDSP